MSVVEKIGGAAAAPGGKRVSEAAQPRPFNIDFDHLRRLGQYDGGDHSAQLQLEMRAIKRRLLRRIGYLRATGERAAFRTPGRQRNLILVTSTRAGEGKTFNAINLALSLALEDQIETLLVDADIPRPKVRSRFKLPEGPGLCDRIRDPSASVAGMCWRAAEAPLSVLGEGAPAQRVTDLYATEAAQGLFAELSRERTDRLVIIDAPPVLATTETVILAKYVDEIVFVVEANSTPEPAVASAIDELLDINPNVSLILNRCVLGAGGTHYESYGYYGRDAGGADAQTGDD